MNVHQEVIRLSGLRCPSQEYEVLKENLVNEYCRMAFQYGVLSLVGRRMDIIQTDSILVLTEVDLIRRALDHPHVKPMTQETVRKLLAESRSNPQNCDTRNSFIAYLQNVLYH